MVKTIINSLKRRGFYTNFKIFKSLIIDLIFDIKYDTDTMRFIRLDQLGIDKNRGYGYMSSRSKHLKTIFSMKIFSKQDTFVDLGCGKGRSLLIASEYFEKVKGIELSGELCEIANRNINCYENNTGKKILDRITVIHADVVDYAIDKEDKIFYLYNPFDDKILTKFLIRLEASIDKTPRIVWIIYYYPLHIDIINQSPFFVKKYKTNMDGIDCVIYTNYDYYKAIRGNSNLPPSFHTS